MAIYKKEIYNKKKNERGYFMLVKRIKDKTELENLKSFEVENVLWGTEQIPHTYGALGFVEGDGFYLKMVCEEEDPLRVYKEFGDPVYRDSAMEAFFMFQPDGGYFNFEMNANGALLTEFGMGRTGRKKLDAEIGRLLECRAVIEKGQWCVYLHLPLCVLEKFYGPIEIKEGDSFRCNFYKISETKETEHYASCFPIDSETPNFHLPEFFGTATID